MLLALQAGGSVVIFSGKKWLSIQSTKQRLPHRKCLFEVNPNFFYNLGFILFPSGFISARVFPPRRFI